MFVDAKTAASANIGSAGFIIQLPRIHSPISSMTIVNDCVDSSAGIYSICPIEERYFLAS
jgi:hypothetical protein